MLRKILGTTPRRRSDQPCAWFHGVSVGEIHLLRQVVDAFRQRHPDWECVISTTTDTGHSEACKRFPDLEIFYWPYDFTWAVKRALKRIRPSLVLLVESELWPNFIRAAHRQQIPVAVINGPMSPRSSRRYHLLKKLVQRVLKKVDLFLVQTEDYARNFRTLGVQPERIHVTGSVKYDGVVTDRRNPRTEELRRLLNILPSELVWIAGSTQAPEESIVLDIFRKVKEAHSNVRLIMVPRHKDRFDEVAGLLEKSGASCLRRSSLRAPVCDRNAIILVDSIGELGALWGLADVALVGGSFDGKRGGQNMIEPAAYGAAVVFGPHVWNFWDTVDRLKAAGAAVQVQNSAALRKVILRLLSDPAARQQLGSAAQNLVLAQQGATERTLDVIDNFLAARGARTLAA
jgi:3-deoxy-D-manno-octulosonic-acid transferase